MVIVVEVPLKARVILPHAVRKPTHFLKSCVEIFVCRGGKEHTHDTMRVVAPPTKCSIVTTLDRHAGAPTRLLEAVQRAALSLESVDDIHLCHSEVRGAVGCRRGGGTAAGVVGRVVVSGDHVAGDTHCNCVQR